MAVFEGNTLIGYDPTIVPLSPVAALALAVPKTFHVACKIKLHISPWKEFQGAKINLRSLANSTKAKRRTEWGSPQIRQSLTYKRIAIIPWHVFSLR